MRIEREREKKRERSSSRNDRAACDIDRASEIASYRNHSKIMRFFVLFCDTYICTFL